MRAMPVGSIRTTLGIVRAQLVTCPQAGAIVASCTQNRYSAEADLSTPIKTVQALDKKAENAAVHRWMLPLATTTS